MVPHSEFDTISFPSSSASTLKRSDFLSEQEVCQANSIALLHPSHSMLQVGTCWTVQFSPSPEILRV